MGNFLQKAPAARPASPPHNYALASTPLEELADSAHEQSMSAHTMQSTLRLLIVGQAPIEPWKLVGEPPRGVSRATSLRSLTSMRLTPCPVALPRSWLASAAAGVTIGELVRSAASLCLGAPVRHRRDLIHAQEEEEHPRRGLTFLLSGLDDEEQIHVRACVEINH
ncbi:unnamed protein product [Pelagomonas calceolata]|uniref:Uncharacterized protein n=1 Tax=Pelagomonas calceolata TaxID=35677 RepID=A0A8J2SG09_9STRA|nr:unnamed protein product [Pelagomonas calceolata]